MNITVYLGAFPGNDPSFELAVKRTRHLDRQKPQCTHLWRFKIRSYGLDRRKHPSCRREVIGVEPQFFIDSELQHDGLTRLIVTQDMEERKAKMIELGDAFIAFPGGTRNIGRNCRDHFKGILKTA